MNERYVHDSGADRCGAGRHGRDSHREVAAALPPSLLGRRHPGGTRRGRPRHPTIPRLCGYCRRAGHRGSVRDSACADRVRDLRLFTASCRGSSLDGLGAVGVVGRGPVPRRPGASCRVDLRLGHGRRRGSAAGRGLQTGLGRRIHVPAHRDGVRVRTCPADHPRRNSQPARNARHQWRRRHPGRPDPAFVRRRATSGR